MFATLVLCAAYGEVATFLLGPALPALGQIYDRTPATVQLTIVSFAVMFALGQLFFGPFSDRRGRCGGSRIHGEVCRGNCLCAARAALRWERVSDGGNAGHPEFRHLDALEASQSRWAVRHDSSEGMRPGLDF